jgi:phosphoribosylformylglycinamidine (FGAM) synthase-like enzyme
MVGTLPDPGAVPVSGFVEEGHAIALLGPFAPALEGSELEKLRGRLATRLPAVSLSQQAEGLETLRAAVRAGGLATAHDVSEGGLACALAECCIAGGIGASMDLTWLGREALFGEGPGGAVVAGPGDVVDRIAGARRLGVVGGDRLQIDGLLDVEVAALRERFEGAIPAAFA